MTVKEEKRNTLFNLVLNLKFAFILHTSAIFLFINVQKYLKNILK